jgi:hypothetical protein
VPSSTSPRPLPPWCTDRVPVTPSADPDSPVLAPEPLTSRPPDRFRWRHAPSGAGPGPHLVCARAPLSVRAAGRRGVPRDGVRRQKRSLRAVHDGLAGDADVPLAPAGPAVPPRDRRFGAFPGQIRTGQIRPFTRRSPDQAAPTAFGGDARPPGRPRPARAAALRGGPTRCAAPPKALTRQEHQTKEGGGAVLISCLPRTLTAAWQRSRHCCGSASQLDLTVSTCRDVASPSSACFT